ncbi:hypothetical protein BJF88_09810 [Cellulosimicrobium sp. CUA-896]|nr:hypothetical protein BJF88_09810 [Cellulosimicrobium sp. CUA-896]
MVPAALLTLTLGAVGALAATVPSAGPATAAEPDLPDGAWVDPFDGTSLGPDWTVVNPVPTALSVADGALTLTSQAATPGRPGTARRTS